MTARRRSSCCQQFQKTDELIQLNFSQFITQLATYQLKFHLADLGQWPSGGRLGWLMRPLEHRRPFYTIRQRCNLHFFWQQIWTNGKYQLLISINQAINLSNWNKRETTGPVFGHSPKRETLVTSWNWHSKWHDFYGSSNPVDPLPSVR